MGPFETGSFHSTQFSEDSSRLLHVSLHSWCDPVYTGYFYSWWTPVTNSFPFFALTIIDEISVCSFIMPALSDQWDSGSTETVEGFVKDVTILKYMLKEKKKAPVKKNLFCS